MLRVVAILAVVVALSVCCKFVSAAEQTNIRSTGQHDNGKCAVVIIGRGGTNIGYHVRSCGNQDWVGRDNLIWINKIPQYNLIGSQAMDGAAIFRTCSRQRLWAYTEIGAVNTE